MQEQNRSFKANFALVLVCLVWGTTFYAIKVGIEHVPPFAFLSMRHLLAGFILLSVLAFMPQHRKYMKWEFLKPQILPGILLIGLGNGLVGLAEKYVPTGLIGVIFSLVPMMVLVYNLVTDKHYPVNYFTLVGLGLGLFGVYLLFQDNLQHISTNDGFVFGLLLVFICTVAWAAGGILNKKNKSESSTFINTAFQLLSGGFFLQVLSLTFEDQSQVHYSSEALWSLAYLVLVASLLTYNAYIYSIKHLSLEKVSIHTYLNPVVAILLGWAWLGEKISINTLIAVILILISVYFTNKSQKMGRFGSRRRASGNMA